jgi:hypothetical protein
MSIKEYRGELAAKILAGLVSNPSIIQANERCGWAMVNDTETGLADFAVRLAGELLAANDKAGVGPHGSVPTGETKHG